MSNHRSSLSLFTLLLLSSLIPSQVEGVMCASGAYIWNECTSCTTTACSSCVSGYGLYPEGCIQCTPGEYSPSSTSTCTPCAAGTFSSGALATSCSSCPSGSFSFAGASSCIQCPAGTYASSGSCMACAANTYSTAVGATSSSVCQACPSGQTSVAGSTSCSSSTGVGSVQCAAGQASSGSTCTACPAGQGSSGGSSSSCSQCSAGYYSTGGSACTPCPGGTYSTSPGATSCNICPYGKYSAAGSSACSSCSAGTYSKAGSSSCTSCPTGTISSAGESGCRTCPAGYYSNTAKDNCLECAAGTYSAGGSGSCTNCPVGTYSAQKATACTPCPPGKSSSLGSASCSSCAAGTYSGSGMACTQCPGGQYSGSGASSCEVCTGGKYSSANSGSCLSCLDGQYSSANSASCSTCGPGKYSIAGASSCSTCAAGQYSSGGTASCSICPAGKYSNDGASSCLTCSAGSYSSSGASACLQCAVGEYSNANAGSCTDCPAGRYGIGSGSCSICPAGKYSRTKSSSCLTCPAGSYSLQESASCTLCPSGTYSPSPGATDISSCLTCPVGEYSGPGASACKICPGGQYQSTSGKSYCDICQAGYYSNQGSSSCTLCSTGQYSIVGSASCSICPGGQYSLAGAQSCMICAGGQYSVAEASACLECPAGKYSNPGSSSCSLCPAGQYSIKGQQSCSICLPGFFSAEGAEFCTPCPEGTYSQSVGGGSSGVCAKCPGGYYSKEGSASCLICSAGQYSFAGASECLPCETGTYSYPGSSECFPTPNSILTEVSSVGMSVASKVGSGLCIGKAMFANFGLMTKILQNMRYMDIGVSSDLKVAFKTWSTKVLSVKTPSKLSENSESNQLPFEFARYDVGPMFLVNYWPSLITTLIGVGCFGLFHLMKFFLKEKPIMKKKIASSVMNFLILASFNFIIIQIYGTLDEIVLYSILQLRFGEFSSGLSIASSVLGIALLLFGISLLILHFWIIYKYNKLQGNKEALENFVKKFELLQVLYQDFRDKTSFRHSYFAFLIIRAIICNIIIVALYEKPLIQAIMFMVINLMMLGLLILKGPFKEIYGDLTQFFYEVIVFIAYLCALIMALADEQKKEAVDLRDTLSRCIMILNVILFVGTMAFVCIEIYKKIAEIHEAWKEYKGEKGESEDKKQALLVSEKEKREIPQEMKTTRERPTLETSPNMPLFNSHSDFLLEQPSQFTLDQGGLDQSSQRFDGLKFVNSAISLRNMGSEKQFNEVINSEQQFDKVINLENLTKKSPDMMMHSSSNENFNRHGYLINSNDNDIITPFQELEIVKKRRGRKNIQIYNQKSKMSPEIQDIPSILRAPSEDKPVEINFGNETLIGQQYYFGPKSIIRGRNKSNPILDEEKTYQNPSQYQGGSEFVSFDNSPSNLNFVRKMRKKRLTTTQNEDIGEFEKEENNDFGEDSNAERPRRKMKILNKSPGILELDEPKVRQGNLQMDLSLKENNNALEDAGRAFSVKLRNQRNNMHN